MGCADSATCAVRPTPSCSGCHACSSRDDPQWRRAAAGKRPAANVSAAGSQGPPGHTGRSDGSCLLHCLPHEVHRHEWARAARRDARSRLERSRSPPRPPTIGWFQPPPLSSPVARTALCAGESVANTRDRASLASAGSSCESGRGWPAGTELPALALGWAPAHRRSPRCSLFLQERQQVLVDLVLVGIGQAVRRARVHDQPGALDQFR